MFVSCLIITCSYILKVVVWLSGALLVLECMFALWFAVVGNSLFGMMALAIRVQVINMADGWSIFFR